MKLVVFSDLHVHPYRQFSVNNSRMEHCLMVVQDVFKYAHSIGANYILFTGDWFHELGKVPTNALNRSIEVLREMSRVYENISIIAISGNHDQQGRNTIDTPSESALKALAQACRSNFILFDYNYDAFGSMEEGVQIFGIPYMEFPEDFYRILERMVTLINPSMVNILMMHQVPTGNEDNIPSQVDTTNGLLKKFDLVLNGHIHRHQRYSGNLVTVGSPLHHDLGDLGQEKYVLSIDTNDITRITMKETHYPQFRRLKSGEELPANWVGDYVVTDPPKLEESQSEVSMEDFSANNTPTELIQAYAKRMNLSDEYLKVGLNLLKQ